MGRMSVWGSKEVDYEEFKTLRAKILERFKELGFKVEGSDREVFLRYEE